MWRIKYAGILVTVVLISLSCSDSRPTEPIEEGLYDEMRDVERVGPTSTERSMADRATRDGLLECFAISYTNEGIGQYGQTMDDAFLFEFTPEVAESLGLPPDQPWWGKAEDLMSTQNMFRDRMVTDVQMSLSRITTWDVCSEPHFNGAAYCARVNPDIRVTVESPGGDTFTMLINNTWLDFIVAQDPDYPELWAIGKITEVHQPGRERPLLEGATLVESATWGMIKAMFTE
jgi:hypothetical protein